METWAIYREVSLRGKPRAKRISRNVRCAATLDPLEKTPVLKKRLLNAGKVPGAGKIPFQGWKNTKPNLN